MTRNMSWSQSETLHQCPRRWHHQYVLNDVADQASEALAFGKLVHTAAEAFFLTGLGSQHKTVRKRMRHAVQYAWDNRRVSEIEWTERHRRRLMLAMYSLEEVFDLKTLTVPSRMSLERKIRLTGPPWPIVGVADMVAEEDGRLVLTDFKTGRLKSRTDAPLGQVAFYAYMWSQIEGNRPVDDVSVVYLGVPWQRHAWSEFNRATKSACSKVMMAMETADRIIETGESEARPSALCGWCPAVALCPEGRKVVTKRIKEGKSVSEQAVSLLKEEL